MRTNLREINPEAYHTKQSSLLIPQLFPLHPRFLLHFAYAELQESQNKNSEVHTAFDSLIATLHDQLESLDVSIKEEVEAARASVPSTGVVNGELNMERDERGKQVLDKRSKELEIMRGELGIVWIMLMRFARRAEGLKPARSVFTKARKDKWASWGVYEAAGEWFAG